jgi:hypothetical protein
VASGLRVERERRHADDDAWRRDALRTRPDDRPGPPVAQRPGSRQGHCWSTQRLPRCERPRDRAARTISVHELKSDKTRFALMRNETTAHVSGCWPFLVAIAPGTWLARERRRRPACTASASNRARIQMWTGRGSNVKSNKTSVRLRAIPAAVPLLFVTAASAFSQGPLYTFRAEGENASAYSYEVTTSGYKSVSVSVSLGGTVENRSTFLYYSRSEFSNGVYTTEYGYGLIPNSSVISDGRAQHLTLDVDLNTVPGFRVYRSIYTYPCPCPIGTPGAPPANGVIAVAWDKTPERWNRSEGHSLTQLYELIVHSQGSFATFSATAQGTIFGGALAGTSYASASIGMNHNVYMAVEHGQ